MRFALLAAAIFSFLFALGKVVAQEPSPATREPSAYTPDVSLISLIATPEKFDGKYVRISGVAYFDQKANLYSIFLTREDKRRANGANSIFLYLAPSLGNVSGLNDKFVLAQGVFRAQDHGRLNSFAAALAEVDRVKEITVEVK